MDSAFVSLAQSSFPDRNPRALVALQFFTSRFLLSSQFLSWLHTLPLYCAPSERSIRTLLSSAPSILEAWLSHHPDVCEEGFTPSSFHPSPHPSPIASH